MSPTVVVGLDGSRESYAAADWAAREALRREAVLDLVQVHETGPYPYSPIMDDQVERDWGERTTRETAEELTHRYRGLQTTRELLAGRPSRVLTEIASTSDLLVLGSRGLGLVLGFVVGSVALPTVAHARCPVVLIRAGEAGDGASAATEDVVVGLKLDGPGEELLSFAFHAAARCSAVLRVVHGWQPPSPRGVRHSAAPSGLAGLAVELADEKAEVLDHMLRPWHEKFPDVAVDLQTVVGRPAHQLVEAASDASLLVVGRRLRRTPIGTQIGSVTHAVMHHADVPVAVVPYD